jgi:heme oxygenase
MSKLKELTLENHKKAERSSYARKLLKGMLPQEYYEYLVNQLMIYFYLELAAESIFKKYPDLSRVDKIREDIKELEKDYDFLFKGIRLCSVTQEYKDHISKLDERGLLAHIYVRHFGDMYGGQMIKKRVPGSGTMYDFNDVETLKTEIRALLDDDMADEANRCFEFAIKLFEELDSEHNLE